MDAVKELRGRNGSGLPGKVAKTQETGKCGYCKGEFKIDPKFPHKKFCNDTHRKLFWKYGSMSVGKVAERMERDVVKRLGGEITALRARVETLEARTMHTERL